MISVYPETIIIRDLDSNVTANVDSQNRLETKGIDYAHAKVHAGDFYTVSHLITSVANGSSIDILIITGANYVLHSNFTASAGGDAEFRVYEDTTVSANGTALTAYNNLRSSANTAEGNFYHTPTVTGVGTLLYVDFLPGGGFFGAGGVAGGPIRSGTELDLDVSTNYLLRLTNTSGGAQDVSLGIGFYEN